MHSTRLIAGAATATLAWCAIGAAATAAAPAQYGPFADPYDFPVDCGDFTAHVEGTATTTFLVHLDNDGQLQRVDQFVRAPFDTWTNTTTGDSIVVRGEFVQTYTPVPDTDQMSVTIKGFRYLVNEPAIGVTVQEVGRIEYEEETEDTVSFLAGQHEATVGDEVEALFCDQLR